MGAEPRRNAAFRRDRAQGSELGFLVEAVAGLRLERRRPRPQHPLAVSAHRRAEAVLAGFSGRPEGGEDPAAGRMQLLVARAPGAERELVDAVAREAGMRVAVDEAG